MGKFKRGLYNPQNPHKWKNDKIVYRSSWELRFNKWADLNPNVLLIASERVTIPYFWEVDQKQHRYFVDYLIKVKTKNGEVKNFLVEVKPHGQTIEPKRGRKNPETFQKELITYSKNVAKWKAATKWCEKNGVEFIIITEKHLFK